MKKNSLEHKIVEMSKGKEKKMKIKYGTDAKRNRR